MANTYLSTNNISLYTIPIAWITCVGPHIHAINLYKDATGTSSKDSSTSTDSASEVREDSDYRFDKTNPRTLPSLIKANPHPALTPALKARLLRLEAASWNGYENLGLFCSAVVAANLGLVAKLLMKPGIRGGGDDVRGYVWWMNVHSIGYVMSRIVFKLVYDRGVSGFARGAWFYAGIACCVSLVVRAGGLLRKIGL